MFAVAVGVAHAVALAVVIVAEAKICAALTQSKIMIANVRPLGMKGVSFQRDRKLPADLIHIAEWVSFVMTERASTRLVSAVPIVNGRNKNRARKAIVRSSNATGTTANA